MDSMPKLVTVTAIIPKIPIGEYAIIICVTLNMASDTDEKKETTMSFFSWGKDATPKPNITAKKITGSKLPFAMASTILSGMIFKIT